VPTAAKVEDFPYVTEEFFVSGSANGAPYATRIIVRRPTDPGAFSGTVVAEALHAAYDAEPFVHVLPRGTWPRTGSVLGSNSVHLGATLDRRTGRVTVVSAIDNLVKGAAGQAVQNANIALGLPETTGLPVMGVAP